MSTAPACAFHLSLWVRSLATSRRFYETVLACTVGRDEGSWIDVDFFGHQLTLHQAATECEVVGQRLDHFGPILGKDEWLALGSRLAASGVAFQLAPLVTGKGTPTERGKFVITDPDGVGLEFKYRA